MDYVGDIEISPFFGEANNSLLIDLLAFYKSLSVSLYSHFLCLGLDSTDIFPDRI